MTAPTSDDPSNFNPLAPIGGNQDTEQQLFESEERYRTLVNSLDVGFRVVRMIFDKNDHAYDYLFSEANQAFERHTGLTGIIGRTVREFVPDHEEILFETYGAVALTGEPIRLEDRAIALNALVQNPIEIGDQMTALGVAMAYTPRAWSDDDLLIRT